MLNCTAGSIDDSNFGKPMPVIGLYIAAASLLCATLMAMDAGMGLRRQRYWIPTKYFSVDAASLTVVGVAIKLSVDLSSAMPSKVDQLAKLSTSAFICTVLANMLPSLGRLANGELLSNTIALFILIITSIVNLCIQLNTGVIHAFKAAHIVMIVMMSLLLHECIATASCLPAVKRYLNYYFTELKQDFDPDLDRVSMMAQSGCPQFVMARSLRCFSVNVLGLVSASTFFLILIASIIHKDMFMGLNTCSGESDYKWSVLGILIAQTFAVLVGLVAPISRLIYFISAAIEGGLLHRPRKEQDLKDGEDDLKSDEMLQQAIKEVNESPIFSYIEDRRKRPTVYLIKYVCRRLLFPFRFLCESAFTSKIIISIFPRKSSLQKKNDFDLYLLRVEGEEILIKSMQKYCSCETQRYIDAGKRGIPQNLIKFLKEHLSYDLNGVASFVDDGISFPCDMPVSEYCWSLAVVTLTSVATALPNIDPIWQKKLMKSVKEGLMYVKLVEDHVKGNEFYMWLRAVADSVWLKLDRERSWLGINLQDPALERISQGEVLSRLADSAFEIDFHHIVDWVEKGKRSAFEAVEFTWAAVLMHRVCNTMLQQDSQNEASSEVTFKKLSTTIADILGACFTNLKPCIDSVCESCPIEKRRETVYHMLKVFGETEEIMKILEEEGRNIPDVPIDKRGFLHNWLHHLRQQSKVGVGVEVEDDE